MLAILILPIYFDDVDNPDIFAMIVISVFSFDSRLNVVESIDSQLLSPMVDNIILSIPQLSLFTDSFGYPLNSISASDKLWGVNTIK